MRGAWRLEERDGLLLAVSDRLEAISGIAHAFTTRRGDGGDAFDLGRGEDRGGVASERRVRVARAAGIAEARPFSLRQVHGDRIVRVDGNGDPVEADGAIWARGDGPFAPAVRTADCVPVLLLDEDGRAAAAVHAGWRGVASGIAGAAVRALAERGIRASRMVAALGPAIGPCCYEVGGEVARAVAAAVGLAVPAGPAGRTHLDLRGTLARQLRSAGLTEDAVEIAPWCTRCSPKLFFSHRRDGAAAGRMLAVVGPTGGP